MSNLTNEAHNLTRDDYFASKKSSMSVLEAISYANVIANNRNACQNEGIIDELAALRTQTQQLAAELAAMREAMLRLLETADGYGEKGWFAELMRKIAER